MVRVYVFFKASHTNSNHHHQLHHLFEMARSFPRTFVCGGVCLGNPHHEGNEKARHRSSRLIHNPKPHQGRKRARERFLSSMVSEFYARKKRTVVTWLEWKKLFWNNIRVKRQANSFPKTNERTNDTLFSYFKLPFKVIMSVCTVELLLTRDLFAKYGKCGTTHA